MREKVKCKLSYKEGLMLQIRNYLEGGEEVHPTKEGWKLILKCMEIADKCRKLIDLES